MSRNNRLPDTRSQSDNPNVSMNFDESHRCLTLMSIDPTRMDRVDLTPTPQHQTPPIFLLPARPVPLPLRVSRGTSTSDSPERRSKHARQSAAPSNLACSPSTRRKGKHLPAKVGTYQPTPQRPFPLPVRQPKQCSGVDVAKRIAHTRLRTSRPLRTLDASRITLKATKHATCSNWQLRFASHEARPQRCRGEARDDTEGYPARLSRIPRAQASLLASRDHRCTARSLPALESQQRTVIQRMAYLSHRTL